MTLLAAVVTLAELNSAASNAKIYSQPIGARMEFFARKFIDTPYVGGSLDTEPTQEKCIVLLDGLDCVTFMETVFALSRTPNPTESKLRQAVTQTRYWNGKVDGYLSRLHYTTDWFYENNRRGFITDISAKLPGAELMKRKVSFMSNNFSKYPALKANPNLLPKCRELEAASNARTKWYVPLSSLRLAEKQLRTGDIIGLVGGADGIDISHVGLIIVQNEVPHFVHASSTKRKVTFDEPLSDYLNGSKRTEGIIVARPR